MAITQVLRSRGDDPSRSQRRSKDFTERLSERMDILLKGLQVAETVHGFVVDDEKDTLNKLRQAQIKQLERQERGITTAPERAAMQAKGFDIKEVERPAGPQPAEGRMDPGFIKATIAPGSTLLEGVRGQQFEAKFIKPPASFGADRGANVITEKYNDPATGQPRIDIIDRRTGETIRTIQSRESVKTVMDRENKAIGRRNAILKDFSIVDEETPGAEVIRVPNANGQGFTNRSVLPKKEAQAKAEATRKLSVGDKIAKMGAEKKKRYDSVVWALSAVRKLQAEFEKNPDDRIMRADPFGVRGKFWPDNEYSIAAREFVEGLSRPQSGAALRDNEKTDFRNMVPGALDDENMARKKLRSMEEELEGRIRGDGIDPEKALEFRAGTLRMQSSKPPPEGLPKTIEQNGVIFDWDGKEFVPRSGK